MSLFDRLFNKDKDKQKPLPQGNDNPFDPVNDDCDESESAFLQRIGEFALQSRPQQSPAKYESGDLNELSINAFEEPEMHEATQSKIDELKSIIQHIESRAPDTREIVLKKKL